MVIAVLMGSDDESEELRPVKAFAGEDAEVRAEEYADAVAETYFELVREVFADDGSYLGGDVLYSEDDTDLLGEEDFDEELEELDFEDDPESEEDE